MAVDAFMTFKPYGKPEMSAESQVDFGKNSSDEIGKPIVSHAGKVFEIDTYSFTKECVQVYTMHSSHATLANGVRTNSVCPAPIDTPLLPDFRKTLSDQMMDFAIDNSGGRLVTPREVAFALGFLGSDAAVFVNGVNLNVDAGFTASMVTGQIDFSTLA